MTRRLAGCSILGVLLSLLMAGPARAGGSNDPNRGDQGLGTVGGIRYRSDRARFDANGAASVRVGCGGPAWHVLGGGAHARGSSSLAWLVSGRPIDSGDVDATTDDGWQAGGSGADGARFTGYSICVRNATIRYRFNRLGDAPTGDRSGAISCGAGGWSVASGSPSLPTSDSWVHSSLPRDGGDPDHRSDDSWSGRGFDAAGGTGEFSIHAVCTRDRVVSYVERGPRSVASGEVFGRRVSCRHGDHVVGGGADVSGPAERARLVSSFPFDGGDAGGVPDDGWQVRVDNVSGADKDVTAFAICI